MPQIGVAIQAAVAFVGSVAGNIAAYKIGEFAIGKLALDLFTGVAASALVSKAAAALRSTDGGAGAIGTKLSASVGEEQSGTIILGTYVTGGHVNYYAVGGKEGRIPNAYSAWVYRLSEYPITRVKRFWVNDEWADLRQGEDADYGFPVKRFFDEKKQRSYMWVNWSDGRETVADPRLVRRFENAENRPWGAEMVGRGIAKATVSTRFDPKRSNGAPRMRFEIEGAALYDPRRDSTAGGSGGHRLNDPSTWEFSDNAYVISYNILLGFTDPVSGEHLWGGQGILPYHLPLYSWVPAMNFSYEPVDGPDGQEPRHRAGIEVRITEMTPQAVVERLLEACGGGITWVAGQYLVDTAQIGLPVFDVTDDMLIITARGHFAPFPGINETYNGVIVSHPHPEDGWETRELPLRLSDERLDEDLGRRNVAQISAPTIFRASEGQRLAKHIELDERNFRRNLINLPPAAGALTVFDVVRVTLPEYGYLNKLFRIVALSAKRGGYHAAAIREVDPSDYDWNSSDLVQIDSGYTGTPPVVQYADGFSCEPSAIRGDGGQQSPSFALSWNPFLSGIENVGYRFRLVSDPEHQPISGEVVSIPEDNDVELMYATAGVPVEGWPGEPVVARRVAGLGNGRVQISRGVKPATDYTWQARYRINSQWQDWTDPEAITSRDIRIGTDDLDAELRNSVLESRAGVNALVADMATTDSKADAALVLAQQAADATGTAGRLLAGGWAQNPSFTDWTADAPDHWEVTGATVTLDPAGYFEDSAARLVSAANVPASIEASLLGTGLNSLTAPTADWVLVTLMLEYVSGNLADARLAVEWRAAPPAIWTQGQFGILTQSIGSLPELGFRAATGSKQMIQKLVRRPDIVATDIRVRLELNDGTGGALEVVAHSLDLRAASDPEIAGVEAGANVGTRIAEHDTEIRGVIEGVATRVKTVEASTDDLDARVTDETVARVSETAATAARFITVETQEPGDNLVKNGRFRDGARAEGDAPEFWKYWPSGWKVLEKGPGLLHQAARTAPAPHMVAIPPSDIGNQTATISAGTDDNRVVVHAGERISVAYDYATGGAAPRKANPRLVLRFYDAAGDSVSSHYRGPSDVSSASWSRFRDSVIVPAGAVHMKSQFRRNDGGSDFLYATNIEVRRVDPDLDRLLNSVLVLRAGGSSLQLTEIRNGETVDTVARIIADDILLNGTVGTRHLVVGTYENMLPGNQFQGDWGKLRAGGNLIDGPWRLVPTGGRSDLSSVGRLEFRAADASDEETPIYGTHFAVQAGRLYHCKYVSDGDGDPYQCRARILFYDEKYNYLTSSGKTIGDADLVTAAGPYTRQEVVEAPAGASLARWAFYGYRAPTESAYIRMYDSSVRNLTEGVEIRDGAVTAKKIDVVDLAAISAVLGDVLITSSLSFADGVILTNAVGFGQISEHPVGYRNLPFTLADNDVWYDVVTVVVDVISGVPCVAQISARLERAERWRYFSLLTSRKFEFTPRYRLRRGSTTVGPSSFEGSEQVRQIIDPINSDGTIIYKLQVRADTPPEDIDDAGDGINWERGDRDRAAQVDDITVMISVRKR